MNAYLLVLSTFFILNQSGITCQGNSVAHSGQNPGISISNEDNAPSTCLPTNVIWALLQLGVPYEETLGHMKLTVKAN